MSVEIGERVGAILKATNETVHLLGYGVFDGPQELPKELELWPGQINPRITLDNGTVIYGFQCWWGAEEVIKKKIAGRRVIDATIGVED
jgi:hypothetical protein